MIHGFFTGSPLEITLKTPAWQTNSLRLGGVDPNILKCRDEDLVVTVDNVKVAYFPVPKAANTSMKHLLHNIRTGEKYVGVRDEAKGTHRHIHKEYGTPKFSSINPKEYRGFFKIAIVRDPVDRVISAWRNRVVHHKDLDGVKSARKIAELGINPKPSLSEFVYNIESYRSSSSSIEIHTDSLTEFLGSTRSYYDIIFDISESRQIELFFSTLTGEPKKLPRKQVGGPPADRDELSAALIRKLESVYENDYQVFGHAFGKQSDDETIVRLAEKHKASLNGFFKRFTWGQWAKKTPNF